ncbi:MAG TPA: helix-turn-helix transcriptional regulator [Bacillota bacterium]|nr:MAG: HTH-type transcriptional regulator Xre [Firmicutes bacterium ADurb.Bin153]HNV34648.1 helix-turn-helix transcriptional regulator [Bacillota bacterium]HPU95350.1 helix-turn-helix transcriptional regulator [Bacillota bacterium]
MDFCTRLRQIRTSKGMSQAALAGRLGLSKQAIHNYESGANTPTHGVLIRIADEMEVSLDYLTGRSGAGRDLVAERKPEAYEGMLGRIAMLTEEGRQEVSEYIDRVMEREASYDKR